MRLVYRRRCKSSVLCTLDETAMKQQCFSRLPCRCLAARCLNSLCRNFIDSVEVCQQQMVDLSGPKSDLLVCILYFPSLASHCRAVQHISTCTWQINLKLVKSSKFIWPADFCLNAVSHFIDMKECSMMWDVKLKKLYKSLSTTNSFHKFGKCLNIIKHVFVDVLRCHQ